MSARLELPLMYLYLEVFPLAIVGAGVTGVTGTGVGVVEARWACWYSCSTSPS